MRELRTRLLEEENMKQTETHTHKPRPKGHSQTDSPSTRTQREPGKHTHLGPEDPKGHPQTDSLSKQRQSQANTGTRDPRTQGDTHRQRAHPPRDAETEPGKKMVFKI